MLNLHICFWIKIEGAFSMYKREIEKILKKYTQFPVVAILGPRQSGKTTLAKNTFKNYVYTSFEDPYTRDLAKSDPHKFLEAHDNKFGIIIDEFQYVPEILSYIQLEVDEKKRAGYFILTGSQNFLMSSAITQSLAGRVGILTLLPLSISELKQSNLIKDDDGLYNMIFSGGYPRIYSEKLDPILLYPSYIHIKLVPNFLFQPIYYHLYKKF